MDLEPSDDFFQVYWVCVFPLKSQALDVVDEFENRLTQFSILSDIYCITTFSSQDLKVIVKEIKII